MRQISPLDEKACIALNEITVSRPFAKGEQVLAKGDVCSEMYFVVSGGLRGAYTIQEKDVTCWISLDGSFATSFASLVTGDSSHESIMAIEDTEVFVLPFKKLEALFREYHEIETLGRLISQRYYIQLEARTYALQFLSAAERYDFLLKNNPQLILRVPLGYLASYIGVSPETLSRIRAKA